MGKSIIRGGVAALAALSASSGGAVEVPLVRSDRAVGAWLIEGSAGSAPEQWVDEYTSFLKLRIYPSRLQIADRGVYTRDGVQILPPGTQLVGLDAADRQIACQAGDPASKRSLREKGYCLIDSDGNGSFDEFFQTVSAGFTKTKIPKKRLPLTELQLVLADPRDVNIERFVYLQYSYHASWVNELIFSACMRKDVRSVYAGGVTFPGCLTGWTKVNRSALPATFEMFGGKFAVIDKAEKKVLVRQLSPTQMTPLYIE